MVALNENCPLTCGVVCVKLPFWVFVITLDESVITFLVLILVQDGIVVLGLVRAASPILFR